MQCLYIPSFSISGNQCSATAMSVGAPLVYVSHHVQDVKKCIIAARHVNWKHGMPDIRRNVSVLEVSGYFLLCLFNVWWIRSREKAFLGKEMQFHLLSWSLDNCGHGVMYDVRGYSFVNTMAADALAPYVARTSAIMVMKSSFCL